MISGVHLVMDMGEDVFELCCVLEKLCRRPDPCVLEHSFVFSCGSVFDLDML